MAYSKQDLLALLSSRNADGTWEGVLPFPGVDSSVTLRLEIADTLNGPCDKTVELINQVVAMSQEQQQRFRELLFADALRAREEIAFGDDTVTVQRPSFWTRLLRRRPTNTFTPLDTTDPRHPCYVEGGVAGVNRKVRFDEVYVSEPEQNSLRNQFAVLHCYPAWEDEHGVSIIIRNGIPIALTGEYEPSLAQYDDI